jgi:hypothetical protein
MSRNRARLTILSEVLSFPTLGNMHWVSNSATGVKFQIGDLVALHSAPVSKWYLSWLKEIDPNNGWPKYLLESIEDGALCWWENIGLSYYDRERIANRPEWKWDDEQYAFNDRWRKVCFKKNDAYIVLPCQPTFLDDGAVMLDVRIRFGLDDYHNPVSFPNWRKVTMKAMDEYYKRSEKEYKAKPRLTPHAPDKSGDSVAQAETVKSSNPPVESAPL